MKKIFIDLFENYGYIVETYGNDEISYVADNGKYCVFFTVNTYAHQPEMAGVSFKSSYKDEIKKIYRNYNDKRDHIGYLVCHDCNDKTLFQMRSGNICNHDLSFGEIRMALKDMKKIL